MYIPWVHIPLVGLRPSMIRCRAHCHHPEVGRHQVGGLVGIQQCASCGEIARADHFDALGDAARRECREAGEHPK